MLKRLFQAAAFIMLCALLVYAPELYVAVSGPYPLPESQRTLLRMALCTQDADTASAFYRALSAYRKENPTVHLRVVRVNADQLLSLTEPLPDVYLYDASLETVAQAASARFLPISFADRDADTETCFAYPFVPSSGTPLLCAVCLHAREVSIAIEFVSYITQAGSKAASLEIPLV